MDIWGSLWTSSDLWWQLLYATTDPNRPFQTSPDSSKPWDPFLEFILTFLPLKIHDQRNPTKGSYPDSPIHNQNLSKLILTCWRWRSRGYQSCHQPHLLHQVPAELEHNQPRKHVDPSQDPNHGHGLNEFGMIHCSPQVTEKEHQSNEDLELEIAELSKSWNSFLLRNKRK